MTSIGELFPKCNKLAYDARQQMLQIQQQQQQQGPQISSSTGSASVSDLYMVLDELERQLNLMEEELVLREPPGQREKWKRKIRDLRQEAHSLREQGRAADYHRQRQQATSSYQAQREELLRQRRKTPGRESDLQHLTAESESLEQSHRMVNSLIDQGSANLSSLVSQRHKMRGVRGVLNDISNRLGLTQSTMRIIERRDVTDFYLVAAGMVVTCLVLYFVWF